MEIKFKRPRSKKEVVALPFVDEMFNEGYKVLPGDSR